MKRWTIILTLLVGIGLGAAGMAVGPRLVSRYLPEAIRGQTTALQGEVMRKQREGNRLLLTVVTPQGSSLATFRKKVTEIDLLIAEGDTLTLSLRRYEPFVEDPTILQVKKRGVLRPEEGGSATPPGGS